MRITVAGTGYVGLTTGVCLASLGHQVTCTDVLASRVSAVNAAEAPFHEPGLAELLSAGRATGRLRASTNLPGAAAAGEVIFITVGTPQTPRGIDLSQVETAAREIGSGLRQRQDYAVVVLKSTVVPGTADSVVRGLLEQYSGRRIGAFGLCVNPEFLREGAAIADFMNPDRIVVGQWDEVSGRALAEIYRPFDCPKLHTSLRNAEFIKYASNSLLATLISFSNEMAALCEATPGTDVETVLQGVHLDRRLSPVLNGDRIRPGILDFLRAGCGYGGSCLPKDVAALRSFARERNVAPHLLDAVAAVNAERPRHLARLAGDALGGLEDAQVTVLGLAFKPGTDDTRDSPAWEVIRLLRSAGAAVRVYDPIFAAAPHRSGIDGQAVLCSTPEEAVCDADALVLVTACPEFAAWDWRALCPKMRRQIVLDGRNALRAVVWPAGVRYFGIGCLPEAGTEGARTAALALGPL